MSSKPVQAGKGGNFIHIISEKTMQQFFQILISLGMGIIVGVIFTLLKLPLPAPTARAGIAGIAGIFWAIYSSIIS